MLRYSSNPDKLKAYFEGGYERTPLIRTLSKRHTYLGTIKVIKNRTKRNEKLFKLLEDLRKCSDTIHLGQFSRHFGHLANLDIFGTFFRPRTICGVLEEDLGTTLCFAHHS